MEIKKFLDQEGLKHLWSKILMEDYPNNETLIAVLNAIDETKADKDYVDAKGLPVGQTANQLLVTDENGKPKWENKQLPTVSEYDAGKFLRVSSDGTWIAENISNAEEVGF